ncbi:MAG: dihydrolipoyl dehydrogenase [Clostridiaceae bacterium]|nr:dihydrolipoyl dehydrogenase [Clostridiaceae bacterium]MBW4858863.1 dihydrolipoyl dehydrogenase [Clostridiaceae bacterium]MBW4869438.1 dihydrolipoyl dehydrogenase [Clostridiaceae bacterium]
MKKNIAIIGAGPAGYVAAIRGAQLGANIYLIEDRDLGGTCLNRGCIPTKAYFRNAEIMTDLKNSEEFGIKVDNYSLDGKRMQERKNGIVNQLVKGIEKLLSSYENIEYIAGRAKLKDKSTILVKLKNNDEREIFVDNILIATGSKPTMTETKGIDMEGVITSDDLLSMEEIPETLIVVGAGVIGVEFASIYNGLGSNVILLASRMLKNADKEISKRITPLLKKQGIDVYMDIRAKEITKEGDKLKVVARYKNKDEEIEVLGDKVLIASGRGPVVEGLGLDELGIEYSEKGISVNENFETNIEGIYAAGDVNNVGIQLAHVASSQAIYVIEKIMGIEPKINLDIYPNCVFSIPEVADVGFTEEEAKEKGISYKVSKFLFGANGKALTLGQGEGLVKVLSDEENKIIGVHIIGPHANDLIHEGALAISNDLSVEDIGKTIHAHPTLSEAFYEATLGLTGEAIHVAPPRKRKKRKKKIK